MSNGNWGGNEGKRSISVLASDAATQLSELARKEAELMRTEVRADVIAATGGAVGLGLASGAALVGVAFLALAAMFGIAIALPLWASALIVGAALMCGAGLFALVGRRALRHINPPERTMRTLKEDVWCLRHPTN